MKTNAYRLLEAFLRLFERGVGDAMVDVLGVELALRYGVVRSSVTLCD